MSGGSTIVEFWREEQAEAVPSSPSEEILLLNQAVLDVEEDVPGTSGNFVRRARIGLVAGAVAWLGFCAWVFVAASPMPAATALPGMVATIMVPLIMLGVAYLLLVRNSRAESGRYLDTARALRTEGDLLELRLGRVADQLETARQALQDQAALLDNYGAAASSNMEASADLISGRARDTAEQAKVAELAAAGLVQRMDALMSAMPDLEERAARMAAQLMDNGHALSERIDTLEARLHALTELSDDARARTLGATKSLAAQMTQMQEATRATSDEVSGLADLAADRMDAAIRGAKAALALTSGGLTEQSGMLDALIDRSSTNLVSIGSAAVEGMTEQMSEIENRLLHLNGLIEGQQALVANLDDSLTNNVATAEERFEAFERTAFGRSERLADALGRLTAETQRIDGALAAGGITAEKLISCAEGLLVALDSSVRELDETYPAALERFEGRIGATRGLIDSTTPEFERLEAISQALVGRAEEAEALVRGQGERLEHWLADTQRGLSAAHEKVDDLRTALDNAHHSTTRITEGAGPLLITALLRVKDTADQAAERARQALGRAIPEAAQALSDASEDALQRAIGDKVAAQIAHVAEIAEEAVRAAHQASERLMQQLHAIAETSASIEQRIEQGERAAETRELDNFARRSALLIESLNSTAIDVAKLMSNDVTDSAWAAYLKGDRGVFTRRAVKLLDAGESREIALHYDDDPEFREHVNRYIHDFESMLRIILAARDGNALGVAVLSSDMGKLYVALAQAIERLRQ
ncbi:hypothetical protein WG908_01065 [Sphingobium sp. AN641]|uniref:hypothetical protein n=1 Tax=Sphingobium sp. AN641 TaxID=3133443 RepID=UPI0030C51178